jgi:hypothetical protein
MKPSIIRHAVKSEHRLTVARYRDIPKTHAAKDVRYLYHCCVYLKRVEEVNIFTKSNCSTDLGLSSLLAKHKKKSDQRIKGEKQHASLMSNMRLFLEGKRFWNLEDKQIDFCGYSPFLQAETRRISCSYSRLLSVHYQQHMYTTTAVGKQICILDTVQ